MVQRLRLGACVACRRTGAHARDITTEPTVGTVGLVDVPTAARLGREPGLPFIDRHTNDRLALP